MILLKKIQNMLKLSIFVQSQDIITISSFHFAYGGHFEEIQIRIIHGFGYIRSHHTNSFAHIIIKFKNKRVSLFLKNTVVCSSLGGKYYRYIILLPI